jgi:hypothetical protein
MWEMGEIHLRRAEPIIRRVSGAAYAVCILFVVGGFVLIYTGTQSNTSVSMFRRADRDRQRRSCLPVFWGSDTSLTGALHISHGR